MIRTINTELVKRLRTERGWSQEELAIASGLSTRTIQRLETDGKGSSNSTKSIASALEVEMHNLEQMPRTPLIGVICGCGGVIVGATCATMATAQGWISGAVSAYEAGTAMGLVGLVTGLSCALIGWASAFYQRSNLERAVLQQDIR